MSKAGKRILASVRKARALVRRESDKRSAKSVPGMIKRLRSLPAPPTIEERDVEELPKRPTE